MWAEAVGFEPTDRSPRPHVFKTCAIVHSATPPNRYLRPAFDHSATQAYNPREGFEPSDPLLSFLCGPTIASLIKTSYICFRAINSKANRLHIRCKITFTSFQSITTFIYLEVQILTAFLFHSPHHVALRTYDLNHVFATTRSSNCLFSIPVG